MSKATLTFFPVGNGDMCLIKVAGVGTVLIDLNISERSNGVACDLAKTLRDKCLIDKHGRPYVNVLAQTHPDQDHCRGLRDYFYSGPPKDYEKAGPAPDGGRRILVNELWSSPMVFRRKSKNAELCDDAKAFQAEAKRRVKLFRENGKTDNPGDMITIIGEDEDGKTDGLEEILKKEGDVFSEINNVQNDIVSVRVLGPFPKQGGDEEATLCKNDSSVILQITFNGKHKLLFGGDAGVGIWKRLWKKHKSDKSALEYDLLLVPHHCSWHSMSEDSESECDNPKVDNDALNALGQAKGKAFIVSSSKSIRDDDDTPPSHRAKKEYEKILERVDGAFLCVEEETKGRECLEFEIDVEIKVVSPKPDGSPSVPTVIIPAEKVRPARPHGEEHEDVDVSITRRLVNNAFPGILKDGCSYSNLYLRRRGFFGISFDAEYDGYELDIKKFMYLNDTVLEVRKKVSGRRIEDSFILEMFDNAGCVLPLVRDTDGRVRGIKKKLGIQRVRELDDLHTFISGCFCLCHTKEESRYTVDGVFDFHFFLEKLVVPYLYWLSFCEEYGDQPWQGLPHQDECAILQLLSEEQFKERVFLDSKLLHLCGSDKGKFKRIKDTLLSYRRGECPFCRQKRSSCLQAIQGLKVAYRKFSH